MIIQVLANLKEEGYLFKGRHPTVAPFFAGANAAFRRSALEDIGGFDPACMTGEDCDVCAGLSAADYELYMRRGAVVAHNNPSTWQRLWRQWYGYGRYHPYVFRKYNDRAAELYVRVRRPVHGERYVCLFYHRSPVAIVVFLTKSLVLHLAALVGVAGWLARLPVLGWAGAAVAGCAALLYVAPDIRRSGPALGLAYSVVRYVADLALFLGAFVGGFRQRMLYLSASMD